MDIVTYKYKDGEIHKNILKIISNVKFNTIKEYIDATTIDKIMYEGNVDYLSILENELTTREFITYCVKNDITDVVNDDRFFINFDITVDHDVLEVFLKKIPDNMEYLIYAPNMLGIVINKYFPYDKESKRIISQITSDNRDLLIKYILLDGRNIKERDLIYTIYINPPFKVDTLSNYLKTVKILNYQEDKEKCNNGKSFLVYTVKNRKIKIDTASTEVPIEHLDSYVEFYNLDRAVSDAIADNYNIKCLKSYPKYLSDALYYIEDEYVDKAKEIIGDEVYLYTNIPGCLEYDEESTPLYDYMLCNFLRKQFSLKSTEWEDILEELNVMGDECLIKRIIKFFIVDYFDLNNRDINNLYYYYGTIKDIVSDECFNCVVERSTIKYVLLGYRNDK